MSTTISPASTRSFPDSLTVPVDGDLASAASVANPIGDLLTGADAAKKLLYGAKLRPRYSIDIADSTVAPVMKIQPLGSVLLNTGSGVWAVLDHTVTTSLNLLTTLGAANFALKTRYYVYLYSNAGAVAWEISTSAPDNQLRYKSGDASRAYIGTFLSDSAVNTSVIPCYEMGGAHVLYGMRGVLVLNAGTAAVATAVPVYAPAASGQLIPTYARELLLTVQATSTADDVVYVGSESGLTSNNRTGFSLLANTWATAQIDAISEDQANLYYAWNTGGAGRSLALYLRGWRDPR